MSFLFLLLILQDGVFYGFILHIVLLVKHSFHFIHFTLFLLYFYVFYIISLFLYSRKIPEPFASTWMQMVADEKAEKNILSGPGKGKKGNNASSQNTVEKEEKLSAQLPSEKSVSPILGASVPKDEDFSEFDPVGKSEINPETVFSSDDFITKNKEIYKKKNIEESEKILDRQTADWICDNCNSQNFAKLLSGVLRVKCFKCQTARGSTCSLVLSVAEVRTRTYIKLYFLFFISFCIFIFTSYILLLTFSYF
jgi:Ca2+/Na+ antiporter